VVRVLIVLAVIVVVIGAAILAVSRTSFGAGLGAAVAIYDHGKPQVFRANYSEVTGRPPTMQVYLAAGVDPSLARSIGCGVVRTELAKAGLADLDWVVFAASGEALVVSRTAACP
jgi:hypothetical protein